MDTLKMSFIYQSYEAILRLNSKENKSQCKSETQDIPGLLQSLHLMQA